MRGDATVQALTAFTCPAGSLSGCPRQGSRRLACRHPIRYYRSYIDWSRPGQRRAPRAASAVTVNDAAPRRGSGSKLSCQAWAGMGEEGAGARGHPCRSMSTWRHGSRNEPKRSKKKKSVHETLGRIIQSLAAPATPHCKNLSRHFHDNAMANFYYDIVVTAT